ncbi:putative transposase [Mycobacterium xenopi 4042]|uniref:Putative transposase n=1 Tax=Mycobacterium xenopi 4042 TaxID=1299334 RepID=X8BE07_MYCXE|nr:putative transposase [Mycobacterium xenopi 4042]
MLISSPLMTSACCRSAPTPPKGSTGLSMPPTRNARSRCRATFTRQDSTSSCPRHWPPPPSTGSYTTPTSAKQAATASGSPKPWPARRLDLTPLGTSGGRHWADLVATSGQFS